MKQNGKSTLFFLALLVVITSCKKETKTKAYYDLFVGTYTQKESHVDGKGEGIYRIQLDANLNEISRSVIKGITNPTWLVVSEKGLLCAEETTPDGKITSFAIDGEKITPINSVSSRGGSPCHLAVNNYDGLIACANYVGGNVSLYQTDKNGRLSEALSVYNFKGKGKTTRQEAPHAHQVLFPVADKAPELWVVDLGTDTIHQLEYQKDFQLTRHSNQTMGLSPGDGPRHMSFGYVCYVLNELSSTISVMTAFGQTLHQKISTLPPDFKGVNTTAELAFHGDYVYATNRGHNSIAIFKIIEDQKLELVGFEPTRGDCPRHMNTSPDGKYLFCGNQNTDNISIFKFKDDGKLEFVKEIQVNTPVCMMFR